MLYASYYIAIKLWEKSTNITHRTIGGKNTKNTQFITKFKTGFPTNVGR